MESKSDKKPYEKPELITELISSETLRAQCQPYQAWVPALMATAPHICSQCQEYIKSK